MKSSLHPDKPISIKDIARRAKVSHSTVSRALRGSPLVHPDTADAIKRIAAESGYRASAVARSLVNQRTYTIGVVVTTIADPFNAEVLNGIEHVANQHGYSVFLANSRSDPETEVHVVHSFEERRVDGIIVTSSRVGTLYTELLSSVRAPVVFLNNHKPGGFAQSVSIDDPGGARLATAHLAGLGHSRIAYIGDHLGLQSNLDRLSGYRQAMNDSGLQTRSEWIAEGDGTAPGGARAMEQLLRIQPRPTAVFCYNDMTALGALGAVHAAGLSVPRDVSIAGFDDLPIACYAHPPLTTVRQPMERMGGRAMEILLALLDDKKRPPEANVKFQGELIVRQSTAAPPAAEV